MHGPGSERRAALTLRQMEARTAEVRTAAAPSKDSRGECSHSKYSHGKCSRSEYSQAEAHAAEGVQAGAGRTVECRGAKRHRRETEALGEVVS